MRDGIVDAPFGAKLAGLEDSALESSCCGVQSSARSPSPAFRSEHFALILEHQRFVPSK